MAHSRFRSVGLPKVVGIHSSASDRRACEHIAKSHKGMPGPVMAGNGLHAVIPDRSLHTRQTCSVKWRMATSGWPHPFEANR